MTGLTASSRCDGRDSGSGTNVSCLSTLTLRSWNVIEHSSRPSLKMLYDVRQWGPVSRFLNEVEIDIVKNQIELRDLERNSSCISGSGLVKILTVPQKVIKSYSREISISNLIGRRVIRLKNPRCKTHETEGFTDHNLSTYLTALKFPPQLICQSERTPSSPSHPSSTLIISR